MADEMISKQSVWKPVLLSIGITFLILWWLTRNKKVGGITPNTVTILEPEDKYYTILDTDSNVVVNSEGAKQGSYITLIFPTKSTGATTGLYDGREVCVYNMAAYTVIDIKDNGGIVNVNPSQLSNAQAADKTHIANMGSFCMAKVVYDAKSDKWFYFDSNSGY